jgi:phosphoadenosine phosphosulfate reductase
VDPSAPAAFFDSGLEYPWTYDMVAHYGVETIKPERSLPEMLRYGGYWGYENPTDPDAEFDFFAFLVSEPAYRFIHSHGLAVDSMGLRSQENVGRRIQLHKRGTLYQLRNGVWHLCPLAFWRLEDVWGYIASRGLRYNEAYDRMADWGIDRSQQRVSTLLGSAALDQNSRIAFVRQCAPEIFRRLEAEFPMVRTFA